MSPIPTFLRNVSSELVKIILGVIALLVFVLLFTYGTLSPCGILKKEIAREAGKNPEDQAAYALFGGFIERGIDTLGPMQCLDALYRAKTEGTDAALRSLTGDKRIF